MFREKSSMQYNSLQRQALTTKSMQTREDSKAQQLMMKLLMLSIEIDRKDEIIKEVMEEARNEGIIEQYESRCQRYQIQIRGLQQGMSVMRQNILTLQRAGKEKEVYLNGMQINSQLSDRVAILQTRLKQCQQEKIQSEENLKKLRLQKSMAEFSMIKNEGIERNKVRELQNQLINQRGKVELERKSSIEKNVIIQNLKLRLGEWEERQKLLVRSFEQKIRSVQTELIYSENLKKSQIYTSEQKILMSAQQINRLNEQNRMIRVQLQEMRGQIQQKQKEITKKVHQYRMLENNYGKLDMSYKQIFQKLQNRQKDGNIRDRQSIERENHLKRLHGQNEQLRMILSLKLEEIKNYLQQENKLKNQLTQLYGQIDTYKLELRKLKRKPMQPLLCQKCRLAESGSFTSIASQKSLNGININEIIEQTEQLKKSNRRIEKLITQHESVIESSINLYNSHIYDAM